MNRVQQVSLVIFSLMLLANYGFCQTKEIKIRYIGNCGLHITDGTTDIYTDFPYKSGAHKYVEYDDSEIDNLKENAFYIFTHKHSDHYYKGKMKGILKLKNGKKYGKWNIDELLNLENVIPNFKIEVFRTKHNFSFKHISYLITWHGKRIFLSGDTESADTIAGISDIDWAFVPAWLLRNAQRDGLEIKANMLGIYHIGPRDVINITGKNVVMLKKQGEVFSIPFD